MKTKITYIIAVSIALTSIGCETTYDAYGNPRQTVTPGGAVAGAAAAGAIGYAVGKDKNKSSSNKRRVGDRRYGYYDRYGKWRWY